MLNMKEKNNPPRTDEKQSSLTRRDFLGNTVKTAVGTSILMSFPTIVPSSVFGRNAPSNRINVAAIGTGRISRIHDIPGVWQYDFANIMAVCDLDARRAEDGKKLVNEYYSKKNGSPYDGVKVYTDYRE